jgi:hypothetical protein
VVSLSSHDSTGPLLEQHGFLEIVGSYSMDRWEGLVKLRDLLRPDDGEAARCLFVPRPSTLRFKALFADRGLPDDASRDTQAAWSEWQSTTLVAQPSWATAAELSAVVWDELSAGFSREPPLRYRAHPLPYSDFSQWLFDGHASAEETQGHEHEAAWVTDGHSFQPERRTRKQVFNERQDWRTLMKLVDVLAGVWGPERVRLVMWFT